LNPTNSLIHVNLGLIYSKKIYEPQKALYHFNIAVVNDPIMIRAYLSRSELYFDLHQHQSMLAPEKQTDVSIIHRKKKTEYVELALRDLTRAIHLQPTSYILYLSRGRLLLKQK
jgi:hypothetical protein